jgi:MarR family 2-MHQ and catechol resistance regulon transcriptional repressor
VPKQDISGVHIWLILIKAFLSLRANVEKSMRGCELGESDFRVLEVLLHKGALPVNTIGPKVFLTTGSISTAVDRLHKKGFVSRTTGERDRRVHVVNLTPKGRALITRVFSAHAAQMDELAQVLTLAERLQLIAALKKLGKNAAQRLIT